MPNNINQRPNLPLGPHVHDNAIIVNENDSIAYALELMSHYHIRHIPVINDKIKLVGINSATDLLSLIHARGNLEFLTDPISSVMKTIVVTADIERNVYDAIILMYNHAISSIPVMVDNNLEGILTIKDVLKLDDLWNIIKDDEVTPIDGIGKVIDKDTIVNENFTLWQVTDKMLQIHKKQLPVGKSLDDISGILTILDLLDIISHVYLKVRGEIQYLHNNSISNVFSETIAKLTPPAKISEIRKRMVERKQEAVFVMRKGLKSKMVNENDLFYYLIENLPQ